MLQTAETFMVTPQFFAVSPYSYGGASPTPRVAYGYIPTANMNMQYYYVNPTCQQWNNKAFAPQTYAKNPYAIGDSIIKGIVETSLTPNNTKSTEEEDVFFTPYIDCYAKTERTEKQHEEILDKYPPWQRNYNNSLECRETGQIEIEMEQNPILTTEEKYLIKKLVGKQISLFNKGFLRFDGPMDSVNIVDAIPLAQEVNKPNSKKYRYTKLRHPSYPLYTYKDLYKNPIKPLSELTKEEQEDILTKRYVIKYNGQLMGKDTQFYETWEEEEKNLAILRGRIMKRNDLFRGIPLEDRSQEWENFVSKKWDMIMSEAVSLFCPKELVKLILNCFGSDDQILPGYGFCVEEEVDMQDSPYDKETLREIKEKLVNGDVAFGLKLWKFFFNEHNEDILAKFVRTNAVVSKGETVSFQLNYEGPLPNASTNRPNGGFSGAAKTTAGVLDNQKNYDKKMRDWGLRPMVPQVCYKCQMQALNVNPSNAENKRKEFDKDIEDIFAWITHPSFKNKTYDEKIQFVRDNFTSLSGVDWTDYLSRHTEIQSVELYNYKILISSIDWDDDHPLHGFMQRAQDCLQNQIDINTENRNKKLSGRTLNVNPSNGEMVPQTEAESKEHWTAYHFLNVLLNQVKTKQLPKTDDYEMLDKKDTFWWYKIIQQCEWLKPTQAKTILLTWMNSPQRPKVESNKCNVAYTDKKIIEALQDHLRKKKVQR